MTDTRESIQAEFEHWSTYHSTPAESDALIERARKVCPVPHTQQLGGFHVFINYEDVRKGLLDWRTYSSGPSALRPYVEGMPAFPPNSFDPPVHTPWRKVFSDGINTRTAERIEPFVHADTIRLIEAFQGRGTCDLKADFAEHIPMNAIFFILGLDQELHDKVRSMTLQTLSVADKPEEFSKLFNAFAEFGYEQVERRRREPADDYLTVLADARMDDRPLTPEEIGGAVISLLTAGHGTTLAALTNLMYEVLRRPDLKKRLQDDPSLIPAAVDEGLRLRHPFYGLYRTSTKDHELHGHKIKAGDSVLMCWHAGDRDPAMFENPHDFNIDRPQYQTLAFGFGKHSCVGAATARMEMRLALSELLTRLPHIELERKEPETWTFAGAETQEIESLPARFTPVR